MTRSAYDTDLDRNPANYQPLTPLAFLERAAFELLAALRVAGRIDLSGRQLGVEFGEVFAQHGQGHRALARGLTPATGADTQQRRQDQ